VSDEKVQTAYIVSVSREAFAEIAENLPPISRLVDTEQFPAPHFLLFDDQGNTIVLTPVPVEKLPSTKLVLP
jgi:hypothetical protein